MPPTKEEGFAEITDASFPLYSLAERLETPVCINYVYFKNLFIFYLFIFNKRACC